jgi:hypothetical protein
MKPIPRLVKVLPLDCRHISIATETIRWKGRETWTIFATSFQIPHVRGMSIKKFMNRAQPTDDYRKNPHPEAIHCLADSGTSHLNLPKRSMSDILLLLVTQSHMQQPIS